ncbi:MAG: RagB/SusD family nutrient uptake outer membrane protein [Rikenellaceae bacterium]
MKSKIIIFLSLIFASCSLLEEQNYNNFNSDEYFQNTSQIQTALFGVYEPLKYLTNYSQYMGNLGTDETRYYSGSTDILALDTYGFDANNSYVISLWTYLFRGVYYANSAIEGIESSELDEEVKAPYLGEAKFLRGLYYYYLVRYYGAVPLLTSPSDSYESSMTPLESISDIYDQIVEDFTAAGELLPSTQALLGRATSGAGYSFLAAAYLSMTGYPLYKNTVADYQKVIDAAQKVIDLDVYELLSEYGAVFDSENHAESIFEFQAGWEVGSGASMKTFMGVVGQYPVVQHQNDPDMHYPDLRVGTANIRPVRKFAESYEDGDTRKETNIADYYLAGVTAEGTIVTSLTYIADIVSVEKVYLTDNFDKLGIAKFKFPEGTDVTLFTTNDNPLNFALMRYSELLLIMAEAQYHVGGYEASKPYFEQVSSRAGATTWDGIGNIDDRILDERAWELCFESKRFFDLQRLGKLKEYVDQRDSEYKPSDYSSYQEVIVPSTFTFYPIPTEEYDYNLNI